MDPFAHRVWLVRHGEPSDDVGLDPGLTPRGHEQAATLPARLAHLGARALRTSPLRRARETAAPLEAAWATTAVVDPAFRELPSGHADVASRRAWLRTAMAVTFAELDAEQRDWRDGILAAVRALATDTVVTTHAVVINAVTGHCDGVDDVLSWVPAHTSITEIGVTAGGGLVLVARGEGRSTAAVT